MPIGTSRATVLKASVGAEATDILNSDRRGNRGWLTWAGDVSAPVLAASLTLPGDSGTYRNPDNPVDKILSVGDWVWGRPGVVNSRAVRRALDALIGGQIVVPVWDATRGQGSGVAYHVSGFAKFSVTGYHLPYDNRISARYLGPADCAAGGLEAVDTSARTIEDHSVSIALTGRSPLPETLTFTLTSPAHGTAVVDGASSCTTAPVAGSSAACTVTAVYTPDPDANGSDRFTFTVAHGADTSQPGSVSREGRGDVAGGTADPQGLGTRDPPGRMRGRCYLREACSRFGRVVLHHVGSQPSFE